MILVTGATGRVGEQVVRTLRKAKLDVRALVRKGSEYYWLNDTGCTYHFGDLRDPESLGRACRDVRYVVVCSGVRTESRDNNHTSVTVEGHQALFEAAARRGVQRIVLISCMGVEGHEAPPFVARKAAEDLLIGSGIDYTILRACLTEHIFLDLAWKVKDRGRALLPAPGRNRLSPIPSRDLALLAAASLDLARVKNQVVEVGGAETMTARAAFELACEVAGTRPTATVLPKPVVKLGTRIGRPFRRYANKLSELATWFSEDFVVDPSTVRERFGIPLTGLRDALVAANELVEVMRDPELREKRMVHPQFYATVYKPGVVKWADLPDGPPPRRD